VELCERLGIPCFGQASDMSAFGPEMCLTSIVDNWGPHYIKTAQEVLDGTWKPEQPWDGLKEGGLIVTPYNKNVPADVAAAADAVKNGQIDGSFHIFRGPLELKHPSDPALNVSIADGVAPDDGVLLSMQTYAEGVEVIA
jgi:simple sugar transport system substrate-binding protein